MESPSHSTWSHVRALCTASVDERGGGSSGEHRGRPGARTAASIQRRSSLSLSLFLVRKSETLQLALNSSCSDVPTTYTTGRWSECSVRRLPTGTRFSGRSRGAGLSPAEVTGCHRALRRMLCRMDTWPLALRTARLICFPADPGRAGWPSPGGRPSSEEPKL